MKRFEVETFAGIRGMETLRLHDREAGAVVELIPERGGLITRFAVGPDEILYLDESSVVDRDRNVRGGIPILFPMAGKSPRRFPMKQHGFARMLPWRVVAQAEQEDARVGCEIRSDEQTNAVFPYSFRLELTCSLLGPTLSVSLSIVNLGDEAMPIAPGWHPYFRVRDEDKINARVASRATAAFDNRTQERVTPLIDFTRDELDLHLLDHIPAEARLERGASGRPVSVRYSEEHRVLVLWTVRGQDFICVEPWVAPVGALEHGLGTNVEPGERLRLDLEISAE